MSSELQSFIKSWITIFISISFCYTIGKFVPKGPKRLVFIVPIVSLFLLLPLSLSTVNLAGGTAFFISWLGNLKLLLFAFGRGPLALNPQITLPQFLALTCLPIEIARNPNKPDRKSPLNLAAKSTILAILIAVLAKNQTLINQKVLLILHCLLIYLLLEGILAVVSFGARASLKAELEPSFDEPYLATSLQDFWGRRWNLAASRALRHTVYKPTFRLWAGLVGRDWAQIISVWATFVASGLAHEAIYYYLTRVNPTWEVTFFFVLHGGCLAAEIVVRRAAGDTWRLPRVVMGVLTIGFVVMTGNWLFFPQLLRSEVDVRLVREYASVGEFLRGIIVTQRSPVQFYS